LKIFHSIKNWKKEEFFIDSKNVRMCREKMLQCKFSENLHNFKFQRESACYWHIIAAYRKMSTSSFEICCIIKIHALKNPFRCVFILSSW
jgi:hypothetical protein